MTAMADGPDNDIPDVVGFVRKTPLWDKCRTCKNSFSSFRKRHCNSSACPYCVDCMPESTFKT